MITPWRDRRDWNGERSPSHAQRMAAMEAEIKELRRLQERTESKLQNARLRAEHWRKLAYALQRDLEKVKAGNRGGDGLYCAAAQRSPNGVQNRVQTRWCDA